MSSATSRVRDTLQGYVAGRLRAEAVVAAVAEAYYREGGGQREALRPVLDVVERAAPGVVELARADAGPGFQVRLAGREFPREYEAELRRAAQVVLGAGPGPQRSGAPSPGLLRRLVAAMRRLFSASA